MTRTLQRGSQRQLVGWLVPSSPVRPVSYFTTFLGPCRDSDVPYSVEKLFSG